MSRLPISLCNMLVKHISSIPLQHVLPSAPVSKSKNVEIFEKNKKESLFPQNKYKTNIHKFSSKILNTNTKLSAYL